MVVDEHTFVPDVAALVDYPDLELVYALDAPAYMGTIFDTVVKGFYTTIKMFMIVCICTSCPGGSIA